MARRYLVSASLAGLLEVRVEAGMAVATSVLLADLGQFLHPRPSCKPTHHFFIFVFTFIFIFMLYLTV